MRFSYGKKVEESCGLLRGDHATTVARTVPKPDAKPKRRDDMTTTEQSIKTTTEGSGFLSNRFAELDTPRKWMNAFPARYANLPAKIALAFAARDMRNVGLK